MKKCKICDKELIKQKVYCSTKCQYDGYKVRTANRVKKICENCNKEFEIKESSLKYGRGKCCSRKCVDKNKKQTYLGENNPMYGVKHTDKRKMELSDMMVETWKSEFHRKNVKLGLERYIKCGGKFQTEIGNEKRRKTNLERYGVEVIGFNIEEIRKKSEKTCIERYGKTNYELMLDGLHKCKKTSIEKKMEDILINNNIKYKRNFRLFYDLKFKIYDFYLKDKNILIECDGDYWHGNPKFFEKLNETQIKNIENDKFKNILAENNGFDLLRFWEYEIHDDNFENKFIGVLNG
ncbi:hypothetical protein H8D04_01600 [bacterium]|nr:hypothetical protein [bacterium]